MIKNLERYLLDITQFPTLTDKEEEALYKKGDKDSKKKLYDCNLRLVVKVAEGFLGHGAHFEDMIEAGNLGLKRAIETYRIGEYDFPASVRHAWWISHYIASSAVDSSFPWLAESLDEDLTAKRYEDYYSRFFVRQAMINLFRDMVGGKKQVRRVMEEALFSTFNDKKWESRIGEDSFPFRNTDFLDILGKYDGDDNDK